MTNLFRRALAVLAVCAIVITAPSSPRAAQSVPAIDRTVTFILPQWSELVGATQEDVNQQRDELLHRIGPQGRRVRLGFTTYINVAMSPVDPNDTAAVRAALAPTLLQMDTAIARAVAANIPICLSFLTALRGEMDLLQSSAQQEDRRNMQWHSDHTLASGWATLSRYARKQEVIREAFLRELGRQLAARMLAHPDILVAASGDGEVELSHEMSTQFNVQRRENGEPTLLADYSPFAIAEFRDWLRGTGLYASGQPFAGQAYRDSAKYHADSSWATLNADFGLQFDTWALRYEDWSLADSPTADPRAIPIATYNQGSWGPTESNTNGFDAPRAFPPANPGWWNVWNEFRQMMVWRYNLNFAKWITTSPDPSTGATVPAERWFSDQIPADYLFGFTPQNPDLRLHTSASPHWTADIRPYGSLGITSFNQYDPGTGTLFKTLAGVAPLIAERNIRWGVFEWSPVVSNPPPSLNSPDINLYRDEMTLVERYKPSLLVPWYWGSATAPIQNTGFEVELKKLVERLNVPPLTLSRTTLIAATTTGGAYGTPPQLIRVSGVGGETPSWSISSVSPFLVAEPTADGRGFTVAPKAQAHEAGQLTGTVVVTPTQAGYSPATLTVTLNVASAGTTAPSFGAFDTPTEGATVSGEVGVTGWAVDDIGVVGVDIYRSPIGAESPDSLVFLGNATMVPGARPDVQAAFANRPLAEQAGWGYMLLTNMLPGQGNGTFTLHAIARDVDGHSVLLGSRTIVCTNGGPDALPFGTIDTPGQGQTVSGTIVNFGWALSRSGIPDDGSTIAVYIDNVFVGRPNFGGRRPDIEALFPGYPNTTGGRGAVGNFLIDTTQYANGVHTIAWVVTDSAGRSQGIGSRYFTIANP